MSETTIWKMELPDILAELLGPHIGAQAADLWIGKYASDPSASVINFMREVSQDLQFDSRQRNALRTAVHRARTGQNTSSQGASPQESAGEKVALALLASIRKALAGSSGRPSSDFIEDLGQRLSSKDGLQEMAAPALGWIVQGGQMPELTIEQLTSLVHKVYVTLCTSLGPVAADKIFYTAVEHAKTLPEADVFPPSNLIFTSTL
ncbi:MAG: hypothetical protein ACSHXK_03635 [Oceanococcus sp.]